MVAQRCRISRVFKNSAELFLKYKKRRCVSLSDQEMFYYVNTNDLPQNFTFTAKRTKAKGILP